MSDTTSSSPGGAEARKAARLRDRLRAETRAEHEALDAGFANMLAPGARSLYACFLLTNRAGHETVEPLLERSPLGWTGGGRLAALRADCRAMGLPRLRPPRLASDLPALPEAVGAAYVLEGSRLGAAFLLKALRRDPASSLPVRYLEASSDPEPFRQVIALANATPWSEAEMDRAVASANQTFRTFRALAEGARIRMTIS